MGSTNHDGPTSTGERPEVTATEAYLGRAAKAPARRRSGRSGNHSSAEGPIARLTQVGAKAGGGSSQYAQNSITFAMRLPVALAAAASLATLFVPNAARALTWNWSVTGSKGSAQGTFTTAGPTAQAGITETVTGATGTYTRSNTLDAGTYTITALGSALLGDNTFRWDGSNASPLILDYGGISFKFAGTSKELNIYYLNEGGGYAAADTFASQFRGDSGLITSSTLTPQAVPSTLSVLGAGAAFGWSRRLRRRLKTGSVPTVSSFKTASLPSVLSPLA